MKKIRVIRANRGFWKDLFNANFSDYKFFLNHIQSTEDIKKNSKKILWKISQLKVLDILGVFQKVKVDSKEEIDMYFSYNRFINTKVPYVVALENPIALVHYRPQRAQSLMGKRNLKRTFGLTNVKAICCLSKACQSAMNYYYEIPNKVAITQIYPYIADEISIEELNNKINSDVLHCLFVSSDFNLKGGNELIQAFVDTNLINDQRIHIDIITKLDGINKSVKKAIKSASNIHIHDFSFTKEELNEFYKKCNVFVNTTRKDSFSLVTLEALKFGCAFIATDMYAIREMVNEGKNGYLIKPSIPYWNEDNTYNEKLKRKERLKLISDDIDLDVVKFIGQKLNLMLEDRDKLKSFQQYSYELATTGEFSREYILNKWKQIFDEIGL